VRIVRIFLSQTTGQTHTAKQPNAQEKQMVYKVKAAMDAGYRVRRECLFNGAYYFLVPGVEATGWERRYNSWAAAWIAAAAHHAGD